MFEVLGWSPLHHRVADAAGGLRPGQRGDCCPHQLPCNHLVPQVTIQGLELSFGDWAGAGAGYTREWACSKRPHLGTVTKDCVLMENLPEWWVTVMVTAVLLLMVVIVVQVGQAL